MHRFRHSNLAIPALRSQSRSIAEQDDRNCPDRNGDEPESVQRPLWSDACEELQDNEWQSTSEEQATRCGGSKSGERASWWVGVEEVGYYGEDHHCDAPHEDCSADDGYYGSEVWIAHGRAYDWLARNT